MYANKSAKSEARFRRGDSGNIAVKCASRLLTCDFFGFLGLYFSQANSSEFPIPNQPHPPQKSRGPLDGPRRFPDHNLSFPDCYRTKSDNIQLPCQELLLGPLHRVLGGRSLGTALTSMHVRIKAKSFVAEPGTTILETCQSNGICVPFLCSHPDIPVMGRYGLCRVQV
jgi:hypothetical protein